MFPSRRDRQSAADKERQKAAAEQRLALAAQGVVEREVAVLRRANEAFFHLAGNPATSEKALLAAWRQLAEARKSFDIAKQAAMKVSQP